MPLAASALPQLVDWTPSLRTSLIECVGAWDRFDVFLGKHLAGALHAAKAYCALFLRLISATEVRFLITINRVAKAVKGPVHVGLDSFFLKALILILQALITSLVETVRS